MRLFACWLAATLAVLAADNTLTPEEGRAGWTLLFDGRSFRGWQDPAKQNLPGDAWAIENGTLKTRVKPRIREDLLTERRYSDFELTFDWRVSPGGNTGLKYRLQRSVALDDTKASRGPGGFEGMVGRELANPRADRAHLAPNAHLEIYTVGFEMQLIDDARHADARRDARHTTGALYSMIAPTAHPAHPAGEWNSARLVVRGDRVEHWINGVKVLDASLRAPEVRAGVEKRWAPAPAVRELLLNAKPEGYIGLQHHADEAWFKNIKLRAK